MIHCRQSGLLTLARLLLMMFWRGAQFKSLFSVGQPVLSFYLGYLYPGQNRQTPLSHSAVWFLFRGLSFKILLLLFLQKEINFKFYYSCKWECCFTLFLLTAESRQPEKKRVLLALGSVGFFWILLFIGGGCCLCCGTELCISVVVFLRHCALDLSAVAQNLALEVSVLLRHCIRFVAVLAPSHSFLRIVRVLMWSLLSCGNEWLR